jgi:hypothetical protein
MTSTPKGRRYHQDYHDGKRTQVWSEGVERENWRAAAKAEGMTLSSWLRRAANRAVEVERKQEKVREVLS